MSSRLISGRIGPTKGIRGPVSSLPASFLMSCNISAIVCPLPCIACEAVSLTLPEYLAADFSVSRPSSLKSPCHSPSFSLCAKTSFLADLRVFQTPSCFSLRKNCASPFWVDKISSPADATTTCGSPPNAFSFSTAF